MKRLCQYLDDIHQEDIQNYIEKMQYDEKMYSTLSQGIEELKTVTPAYNDNIIFSLYKEVLCIQVGSEHPVSTKPEPKIFYSPLYFVEKMDLSRQSNLFSLNQEQALGAFVVLDKDYPATHMILRILDDVIHYHQDEAHEGINLLLNQLSVQFSDVQISTVNVKAEGKSIEELVNETNVNIFEEQEKINQAFDQKTKQYYQSILLN